jgi:hypothetical protein
MTIMPKNLTSKQLAKLKTSLEDPVEFVRNWLASDVWATQEAILRSIATPHSKTAVKACHSSGKTFIAAAAVLWFLARFNEAIVVTTAPTAKQVTKMLWGDIQTLLQKSAYPFPPANLTEIRMGPKRYAIGFSTTVTNQDEGVRFSSFSMKLRASTPKSGAQSKVHAPVATFVCWSSAIPPLRAVRSTKLSTAIASHGSSLLSAPLTRPTSTE